MTNPGSARFAAAAAAALFASVAGDSPARAADSVEPTAFEQYMVEVLNRTRANPDGEAARFGISLNEGLPDGTLTNEAREPLAVNLELIQAARDHNTDLFRNFQNLPADHRGSDDRDPTERATDAGADFLGGVAENNSWTSQGSTALTATSVNALHALLFKDFTATFEVVGRGHRKVMLNGTRDEVGVAVAGGVFGGRTAALCTQDFVTTNRIQITGVAYADEVTKNSFYTPGEGLWGVRVVATRREDQSVVETLTWRSGGYNLVVGAGTWDLVASGGGLPNAQTADGVVVADRNVKVDFVTLNAVPSPPPPRFELKKGVAKLKKGNWSLSVTDAPISIGSFTLPAGASEQVTVEVDGVAHFLPQDRALAKVKEKLEPGTLLVRKLTVKEPDGDAFTLDLKKGRFTMTRAAAPGFDPTDGSVTIRVLVAGKVAEVVAPAQASGTAGTKQKLVATSGTVN
jgi:uncharacterized protein YkwD